jgi:transposase-like protein
MKLICPKCHAAVKIGGASRFRDFTCRQCNHTFIGLEAEVRWIFGMPGVSMMTGCPYCWTPLELRSGGSQRGGYVGPHSCYSCGRKLPRRPNRQPGTEWQTNFERLVESLKGISMSASRGEALLRSLEEIASTLTPTEFAQVKEMIMEAVRRGGDTLP